LHDVVEILAVARVPQQVFDFDRLRSLFPAQVVPVQAVFRPTYPIFFSPARLTSLSISDSA
jgi:hypothetical protein